MSSKAPPQKFSSDLYWSQDQCWELEIGLNLICVTLEDLLEHLPDLPASSLLHSAVMSSYKWKQHEIPYHNCIRQASQGLDIIYDRGRDVGRQMAFYGKYFCDPLGTWRKHFVAHSTSSNIFSMITLRGKSNMFYYGMKVDMMLVLR